jgi:hypothetical protein
LPENGFPLPAVSDLFLPLDLFPFRRPIRRISTKGIDKAQGDEVDAIVRRNGTPN